MAVALTVALTTTAQFTREQAINLALNQILLNDLDHIDVYASFEVETGPGEILLGDQTLLILPYMSNWVFFVDDHPFANWLHDCRYIFVNEENGEYIIIDKMIYPDQMALQYELVSQIPRPVTPDLPADPNAMITGLSPNPHLYAVLIGGVDYNRYWRDISAIFNTLIDVYGYTRENIFVHYGNGTSVELGNDLDNDGQSDIDFPAYNEAIENTFRNLSGEWDNTPTIPELDEDDQLFVFVTSHGNHNTTNEFIELVFIPPSHDDLWDYELADYVEPIHCAQMIFVFENCFGGGFINDLSDYTSYNVQCKNRLIYTASQADELSNAEIYITDYKYD